MEKWFDRTKRAMREKKVSQEALAEKLGRSQPGLSAWLRGFREPALDDINEIADLLGVSRVWVTHGEGSKYRLDALPERAQRVIERLIESHAAGHCSDRLWEAIEAMVIATLPPKSAEAYKANNPQPSPKH